MIRLRNAFVALVTCLLSVGALAQTAGFTQESETVTVAEELFGSGSVELEFNNEDFEDDQSASFVPKVKLIFTGMTLSAGTEFDVTYTLGGGAKFAERASNNDFNWGLWGPDLDGPDDTVADDSATTDVNEEADNCSRLEFTQASGEVEVDRDGGGKGSGSVTYSVKVVGERQVAGDGTVTFTTGEAIADLGAALMGEVNLADCTAGTTGADDAPQGYIVTGTTRKIVFTLPDIEASGLRDDDPDRDGDQSVNVMVTTTIEQTKSGGTGLKISEQIVNGYKCGGEDPEKFDADAQVSCPVVTAHQFVNDISNSGGSGSISLDPDDDREVLVIPGTDNVELTNQQITLSRIRVETDFESTAYNAEGDKVVKGTDDPKDDLIDILDGNLVITVSSEDFNDGDVVYIDDNANGKAEERERFAMEDGVAEADVDLSTAWLTVLYRPSGDAPMEHETTFAINAHTDYSDTSNNQTRAKAAMATLKLNGIRTKAAKAYAIARPMEMDDTDTTNVRVTCETSSKAGCRVFFQCRDQAAAGDDLVDEFGEDGVAIGPDRTMRFDQDDIADMLGIDTWTGRLACEVLSTNRISVQVLTRSHGVLVNNTPVNEGGTN